MTLVLLHLDRKNPPNYLVLRLSCPLNPRLINFQSNINLISFHASNLPCYLLYLFHFSLIEMIDSYSIAHGFYFVIKFKLSLIYVSLFVFIIYFDQLLKISKFELYFVKIRFNYFAYLRVLLFQTSHFFSVYLLLLSAFARRVSTPKVAVYFFNW